MTTISFDRVQFFSEIDEETFFRWLEKAKARNVRGAGTCIFFDIEEGELERENFIELVALARRYDVDRRSLAVLDANRKLPWLRDKRAFWQVEVFGA